MYSEDFRERVKKIIEEEELSVREAAKRFKISKTTILKWNHGYTPQTKRKYATITVDMDALKQDVEAYPDAYQYERGQSQILWKFQKMH